MRVMHDFIQYVFNVFKASNKGIIIDTGPLILLIIGSLNLNRIKSHPRTKEFSTDQFEELLLFLNGFNTIFVTPYILSELSHHVIDEKRSTDMEKKRVVEIILELNKNKKIQEVSPSLKNVFNSKLILMGANDASLLETGLNQQIAVLTSEGVLADKIRQRGGVAIKFLETLGFVDY